jgi:hypothetical protein
VETTAPATPATPAAPAAPSPSAAPAVSAVRAAIDAARAKVGAGQSFVPEDQHSDGYLEDAGLSGEQEPSAEEALAAHGQPRVPAGVPEGGQFTTAAEAEEGAEEEAPEEAAPEGEEAAEAETEGLVVKLPGRRPGDPELEIEVSDQESADRLRQMSNGYMRGEEVRQAQEAILQDRQEREQFKDMVRTDPIGFMVENLDPDIQAETALYLLTQPDIWQKVLPDLKVILTNPSALRVAQSDLKARRFEIKEQLIERNEARAQVRETTRVMTEQVRALIPADLPAHEADALLGGCLTDLAQAVQRGVLASTDSQDLVVILARRLAHHGIDPVVAAARLAAGGKTTAPKNGQAPRKAPFAAAPAAPAVPKVKVTAQRLKEQQRIKAAAGMASPPGSVNPSSAASLVPKGTGVKGAIAAARARLASGGHLT